MKTMQPVVRGIVCCAAALCLVSTPAPAGTTSVPSSLHILGDEGTVTSAFFPGTYTPGQPVEVRLTVNQFSWGTHVHVEDRFPTGWVTHDSNPPATLAAGKLVWDLPLVGRGTQTVVYKVTAPAGTTGFHTFHHRVVFSNDSTAQQTEADRIIAGPCALSCTATASASSGPAPLLVSFTATATPSSCQGEAAFDWDFGDGSPHSSQASPSHTYATAGTYTWRLTSSVGSVTCTRSGTVMVNPACTLECTASAPARASVGSPVAFQGSATPSGCSTSVLYDWDFGDGTARSSETSPSHVYATAGTFTWRLTATVPGATCTRSGTITVSLLCTISCSARAPALAAVGSAVTFAGSAIPTGCSDAVGLDWDFGDGSAHSTQASPSHTYATTGAFVWSMTASASGAACSASGTVTVSQAPAIDQAGSHVYLVDTSGHAAGSAGSKWVTDLVVHNPGSAPATVNLFFLKQGQGNTGAAGRSASLAAGSSRKLADVVLSGFGESSASGAILVGAEVPLLVTSRTYTTAANGTYGQYVEGTPVQHATASGEAARLIQLTRNAFYRTNIGLANATAVTLTVKVDLHRSDGTLLGSRSISLLPFGYTQENDIFVKAGVTSADDAYAVVSSTTAGAHFLTYASVIDNRTNDPIHVVPARTDQADARTSAVETGSASWVDISSGITDLHVRALACDPTTPGTMYAGSYGGGVFKTTNGGSSWSEVNTGLDSTSLIIQSLAVDPVIPTTVFAGSWDFGVLKTTDGGASWAATTAFAGSDIPVLVVDPTASGTVYAGSKNSSHSGPDVFKTTDGGATWKALTTGMPFAQVTALAIDPLTPGTLYAGGWYIYKTTNGGSSWAQVCGDSPTIYSLTVDRTNPNRVYAGTSYEVLKTTNGGTSWSKSSLSGGGNVRALAVDPVTPSVVYAGSGNRVLKSTNGGASWSDISSGLANADVYALVFDPADPGTLYAATAGSGEPPTGGVFKLSSSSACSFTLQPTSQSIDAAGGTGSVAVTASAPTCVWTATSSTPTWLTITGASSGTGSGTVSYVVSSNASASSRSGTLTIGGQVFTVIQAGAACATPDAPTLVAPASAASGASYTLTWSSTSPDGTYELQESTTASFASATTLTVTGTSRATSHTAAATTTWYARVRAVRSCSGSTATSSWSNIGQTVVGAACANPPAPTLTAPATAASGAAYTLSWGPSSSGSTFDLQESTSSSFAGAVVVTVDGTSRSTSHTVAVTTVWYSRVRAVVSCGGQVYRSDWSNTGVTTVAPPEPSGAVLYLPAAAHATGSAGTNWRTDIEIHNPGATQAGFTLELLKKDQDNSTPPTASFTLDGGQAARYQDVLASSAVGFGFSGSGTIRVTPSTGSVLATSRTYNDQPDGTYGQFIPGQPREDAIAHPAQARLVHLSQSSSPSTGFRTNLGLVNTTASTIAMELKLYQGDGTLLGTLTYTLLPHSFRQIDRIFTYLTNLDIEDGFVVLRTTTTGGSFMAYASVIDNRSGDPIYIPARIPR